MTFPRSGAQLLVVAAVIGCVVMTGCAAPTETPAASTPTPEASTAPAPFIEPGTDVATGVLTGQVSGTVTIVTTEGGKFEVHIDEIETELDGWFTPYFTTQPHGLVSYCETAVPMYGYGQAEMVGSFSFPLDGFGSGDHASFGPNYLNPDFLDDLLLTAAHYDALQDCFYPVVAAAPLTWTLPDMRPDLEVVDSGTTGGATGTVELVDGRPRSYEVASGDVLAEIAARFGIEVDDLFYLNPGRGPNSEDPMAYLGEVYNLDKESR